MRKAARLPIQRCVSSDPCQPSPSSAATNWLATLILCGGSSGLVSAARAQLSVMSCMWRSTASTTNRRWSRASRDGIAGSMESSQLLLRTGVIRVRASGTR